MSETERGLTVPDIKYNFFFQNLLVFNFFNVIFFS